ncbi:MAG: ABC transporter substrate-binding protein, partial [Dehalococcoidales bacterium]|nr:ABC transporter substrate-binding protein [Dehalococcoidales bacterium]
MKKKIVWMVVSGLMALSLVMAACGQAEEGGDVAEEEVVDGAEMKRVTVTKMDGTSMVITTERPEYGGTLTRSVTSDRGEFDPGHSRNPGLQPPMGFDVLLDGDMTRGPAGTHETDWDRGHFMGYVGLLRGSLAESYEIIDDETIIFKIRQGVHFALNPDSEASVLVNGREMTAEDVAYSFERQWSIPGSYHSYNHSNQRMQSATALDKFTLEMKILPNEHGIHLLQTAGRLSVVAREV